MQASILAAQLYQTVKKPLFYHIIWLTLFIAGSTWQCFAVGDAIQLQKGIDLANERKWDEVIELLSPILEEQDAPSLSSPDDSINLAYEALSYAYLNTMRFEEAKDIYQKQINWAREQNPENYLQGPLEAYGEIMYMQTEWKNSQGIFVELYGIAEAKLDYDKMVNYKQRLANIYHKTGNVDSAQVYFEKAREIAESHEMKIPKWTLYNDLGVFYRSRENFVQSTKDFITCLELSEADTTGMASLVVPLLNLSQLFRAQKNYPMAKHYAFKALDAAQSKIYLSQKGFLYQLLGMVYEEEQKLDSAEMRYLSAIEIFEQRNSKSLIASCKIRLGRLYTNQKKYKAAQQELVPAVEFAVEIDDKILEVESRSHLGYSYSFSGDYAKAITQLDLAQAIADSLRSDFWLVDIATNYSRTYERQGNYAKALEYQKKRFRLESRLQRKRQEEIVQDMEAKYNRVKQDQEISLLNKENELKDVKLRQRKQQILSLVGGLILFAGLAILIFYLYRLRQQTNKELADKNQIITRALAEKEILLREIHHRVKNNLQIISSLLRLQSRQIKDSAALDALREGQNRVKSMALIHQNLYQDETLTSIELQDYVSKLIDSLFYSYNIESDRIKLVKEIDPIRMDVDTLIPLGLILNELLTNALKYAFPDGRKGRIKISLKEKEDTLYLTVEDNGIGMPDKIREDSFGQRMVSSFANKLNAKIEITSQNGTRIHMKTNSYKIPT